MTPSEAEEIALARIDWAFQRQLAAVAVFLGLGIGIIELLSFKVSDIGTGLFIFLYVGLAFFLADVLYTVFGYEKEILKWQYRLYELPNSKWEIKIKESILSFFFDCSNRDMSMRKKLVVPLTIGTFLFFILLLLFKLQLTSLVVGLS